MNKPVYASFAVTYHGKWVEPETAAQEDCDILFCEFCRLEIGVVIDKLTGVKSFVHTPLRLGTTKLFTICPYSKAVIKFANEQKTEYGPYSQRTPVSFPVIRRNKTGYATSAISVGYGEKICPQCGE